MCVHIFAFFITLTDLITVALVFLLHSEIGVGLAVLLWVLQVLGLLAEAKCCFIVKVYFTRIL